MVSGRVVVAVLSLLGCGGDDDGGGARADAAGGVDAARLADGGSPDAVDLDGALVAGCADLEFELAGTVIDALSDDGDNQDIPVALTPDATTVLIQRGEGCGTYAALVADAVSPGPDTYDLVDATGQLTSAGLDPTVERTMTILPNGFTIVGVVPDGRHFAASTRSALGLADFGPANGAGFELLAAAAGQELRDPVVSSDGLAFYYTLLDDEPAVAGVYESVRDSVADPFPAGTRMPAAVQAAGTITGISSDRLVLFLEQDVTSSALTRATIDDPFDTPVPVPGFRIRPTADCAALIGSCTAAGCTGEDVCRYLH